MTTDKKTSVKKINLTVTFEAEVTLENSGAGEKALHKTIKNFFKNQEGDFHCDVKATVQLTELKDIDYSFID